jgi:predicted flap endonuclease-1-like 5' DNA nuclease
MMYLLQVFWFWLLLALVLGVAVAWLTARRDGGGGLWPGLLPWGLVLGLGGIVAILRVLPTRAGYWLDLALLMLGAYVIGCLLAALLRGSVSKPEPAPVTERVAPAFAPAPVPAVMPAAAPAAPAKELAVEPMKAAPAAAEIEPIEQAITGLSGPRNGMPDDLTRIYGIDAEVQAKLNALGLYHFDQMAGLSPGQRRWLFRQLGHAGRFPSWWWRWRFDAEQILAGGQAAPAPVAAMGPAGAPVLEGTKPAGLDAPKGGKADDLKRIKGIGKQNEGRLHGLGIWHFAQIAGWSPDEVKWVGGYLAFPGRIEREDWVGQAKILAAGGITDFARRADAGEVASSRDDTNDDGQGNVIVPVAAPKKGRKPPETA